MTDSNGVLGRAKVDLTNFFSWNIVRARIERRATGVVASTGLLFEALSRHYLTVAVIFQVRLLVDSYYKQNSARMRLEKTLTAFPPVGHQMK